MKKWLFNPFEFIAGTKSLLIGLAGLFLIILLSSLNQIHYGAIGIHFSKDTPLWFYFAQGIIGWLTTGIIFYIAGKIFSSSSIRIIDVFGTNAFARIPDILVSLIAFILPLGNIKSMAQNKNSLDLGTSDMATLIVVTFVTVIISVWVIALMWKAYSTSCNLKGAKGAWSFAIGLIIAEIISEIAFYFIRHNCLV